MPVKKRSKKTAPSNPTSDADPSDEEIATPAEPKVTKRGLGEQHCDLRARAHGWDSVDESTEPRTCD